MVIAITGIGVVSALGIGKQAHRQALQQGQSHLTSPRYLPTLHTEWPIGEVPATNAELIAMLPPQRVHDYDELVISRNALIGAVALQEALTDSALTPLPPYSSTPLPLINGTTVGGMDTTENLYDAWRQGEQDTLKNISVHRASENTAIIAHLCGMTQHRTVSTACSSALNAILTGAMMLRAGECQQVVVGGVDAMTRVHLNGFGSLGILSKQICKPFAADRDGINLGEGAAYLVLEDAALATQRGATIYGYIGGYGNCCDAYHPTASSPEGQGAYLAMRQALTMAGLTPQAIPYINAHGTATPNNDASEWCAIERVFGKTMPKVESTKPLTGHTTSASGSIEAYFTLLRMQEKGYDYAMSNAFGFGGNDSSMIFSLHPIDLPELRSVRYKEHELFVSHGEWDDKPYIPSMQARRMTKMVRQLVVVATEALRSASIAAPDAVVVGTQWGAMVPSVALLNQVIDQQEQDLSPSLFMNATNNTMAGVLARQFRCQGYNITIMESESGGREAERQKGGKDENCFEQAKEHALLLLKQGECRTVLVCGFDEQAEGWQSLLQAAGCPATNIAKAQVICIN